MLTLSPLSSKYQFFGLPEILFYRFSAEKLVLFSYNFLKWVFFLFLVTFCFNSYQNCEDNFFLVTFGSKKNNMDS